MSHYYHYSQPIKSSLAKLKSYPIRNIFFIPWCCIHTISSPEHKNPLLYWIFQYPFLSDPILTIFLLSFNTFIRRLTFLVLIPICSAIYFAVIEAFSSNIFRIFISSKLSSPISLPLAMIALSFGSENGNSTFIKCSDIWKIFLEYVTLLLQI